MKEQNTSTKTNFDSDTSPLSWFPNREINEEIKKFAEKLNAENLDNYRVDV